MAGKKIKVKQAAGPRVLGVDPSTSQQVYVINGRFGAYVQLGETPDKGCGRKPPRASLVGGLTEATVTLDDALRLLALRARSAATRTTASPCWRTSDDSVRT